MTYLNQDVLAAIDARTFQATKPYPWVNPRGIITDAGFAELVASLPDVSLFEKSIGMERAYGQKPHDRYELKYHPGVILSPAWQSYIDELSGPIYRAFLARLLGTNDFGLRFQWQYSFRGCSVSPHCDSRNKLGSHIFYFNTRDNWKDEWGGRTLLLDGGAFLPESAPVLSSFKGQIATEVFGNRSLLFERTDRSWHAVSELTSPDGAMRKIFTVIIEKKPTSFGKMMTKAKNLFNGGR